MKPHSSFFANMRSTETDMYMGPLPNNVVVKANPLGTIVSKYCVNKEDEGDSRVEPYVGLEFDTADDARNYYNAYATHSGFRIRIGQLYRSRVDGSVASRRFVCSKEGFQLHSRTGCPAFMRVKRLDSGKWVIDQFQNDHNHELESPGQIGPTLYQGKNVAASKSLDEVSTKSNDVSTKSILDSLEEDEDRDPCPSSVINFKRLKRRKEEEEETPEPRVGLEFNSANEAYKFFHAYATAAGFNVRIGQLFRSKNDGSITSRRFVCSKEGHQHPSRVGCGVFMRIKRQDSGTWVVDRLSKEHNHDFGVGPKETRKKHPIASIKFKEEASTPLTSNVSQDNKNNIESYWYRALFEYFQAQQANDTGFFYAVDIEDGKCKSIFWADGRSRFSCSQFGDAIVFDTTYRRTKFLVPFATFVGVNHHKQPVLLACALIADDSKESFTWLFQTYLRAMSGRIPVSIIADQENAIEQAIAQSFPGIHHCFSMWELKMKEEENLGTLLSFGNEFKNDYEKCIYQSQTPGQFDSAWINLLEKYHLKENSWLKEIYRKRRNWVPLYLRDTFFGGIPSSSGVPSFLGTLLNAQTPISEFILRYERGLEQHREEERKEDINSVNSQPILRTKDPIEEQCRRFYTSTIFKVFQKELVDSYSYFCTKIYEEGTISKYLVKKSGNESEQHSVTLNGLNLNVNCSCRMFDFEGVICRHALKLFQIVNARELPSRLILHRWTKNAKYGILCDVDSGGGLLDLKALMVWSLREEACKYIEAGSVSVERYKLAHEILREGGRNFSWQN